MGEVSHEFPPSQGEYLRAMKRGLVGACSLSRSLPAKVSLVDRMPPVYQQALRGTCVASAVTALVEYYENCKTRLSVQFLEAATKRLERAWIEENLAALAKGDFPDREFASAYAAQVAQLKLVLEANGAESPMAKAMLESFRKNLGHQFNVRGGSLLRRCFKAAESQGICRYSLWPYVNMQVTQVFARTELGAEGASDFPPGSEDDARRHRMVGGFYQLRSPNNVDEIRGLLAGANNRRPMPVVACVPLFDGCCEKGALTFPTVEERGDKVVTDQAPQGGHGVLLVGYHDDPKWPGGGYFIVRNSWGPNWGEGGYGKVSYAYVECFCNESGTVLEDMVDYIGDGYGGMRTLYGDNGKVIRDSVARRSRKVRNLLMRIAELAIVSAAAFLAGRFFR